MNPTQTLNIQQGNLQMLLGLGVAVLLAKALTQTATKSLPSRISPNENSSSSSQPLQSNSSVQDSSSLPLAGSAHNSIYTSTAKDRNLTYQVSVQGSVTFKACDIFREDATSIIDWRVHSLGEMWILEIDLMSSEERGFSYSMCCESHQVHLCSLWD